MRRDGFNPELVIEWRRSRPAPQHQHAAILHSYRPVNRFEEAFVYLRLGDLFQPKAQGAAKSLVKVRHVADFQTSSTFQISALWRVPTVVSRRPPMMRPRYFANAL